MITLRFSNGEQRTFGDWIGPAVIDAYCRKHGLTAIIINKGE